MHGLCWCITGKEEGPVHVAQRACRVLASVLVKTSLAAGRVTRNLVIHRLLMKPSSPQPCAGVGNAFLLLLLFLPFELVTQLLYTLSPSTK